tara:strand:- start:111 stop:1241 length:1131 start_codon:yes stop_codon:yes gene_type:complete
MYKNSSTFIPVHEPDLNYKDLKSVYKTIKKGEISGSFTSTIKEFEKRFAKFCKRKYAVSVSNCTNALQLACRVIGIKKGDEVLVSSSTNIATALAIYHNGGIPVPIDSDPITWNLNENLLEKYITKKTKAIMPVHFLGLPANMSKIMRIAKKHKLKVIEDCAEAHGAKFNKKIVGSFGDIACFSFYSNKIITTGEGGMLVTNNKKYYDKLVYLKNLAFGKPRFLHKEAGYNFRMGSLQAGLGLSQLERVDTFIKKKIKISKLYFKYLNGIQGIQLPYLDEKYFNVYWMFGIMVNDKAYKNRDQLIKYLNSKKIETRTFFCPLTLQPFLRKFKNYQKYDCKVSMKMWKQGLYLPSGNNLTEKQIRKVSNEIKYYLSK